jgi:hypothetical protein
MSIHLGLNSCCAPSDEIVTREIEGETIILPLTSGIGDVDDDIYTLNDTGKAIWQRLDGKRTLRDVARELSAEFNCPPEEIERDVIGFVGELLKRRILIELPGA